MLMGLVALNYESAFAMLDWPTHPSRTSLKAGK
jgi:hypothetical protein